MARARANPDTDRRRSDVVHSLTYDCQTIVQDCLFDGTCLFVHNSPVKAMLAYGVEKCEIRIAKFELRNSNFGLSFGPQHNFEIRNSQFPLLQSRRF